MNRPSVAAAITPVAVVNISEAATAARAGGCRQKSRTRRLVATALKPRPLRAFSISSAVTWSSCENSTAGSLMASSCSFFE